MTPFISLLIVIGATSKYLNRRMDRKIAAAMQNKTADIHPVSATSEDELLEQVEREVSAQ